MKIKEVLLKERGAKRNEVLYILCHVLCLSKEKIFLEMEKSLGQAEIDQIQRVIERRKKGEPLAYIRGSQEFYSEEFLVDRSVLIPRPETELLVEEALRILDKRTGPAILLDMGTGSGAIGITVAKKSGVRVVLVDVSLDALKVARKNALLHGVSNAQIFCSDLFTSIKKAPLFDMILANLPYVSAKEYERLPEEVRDFEPVRALIGGRGGFELYERFFLEAPQYLKTQGWLVCEIGGKIQAKRAKMLLEKKGLQVKTKKDFRGKERVIVAWKDSS